MSTPSPPPLLAVDGVSKRYRRNDGQVVTAVDRVSLTLGEAEVVAVVGASGSGKSTLGRLICGLERPEVGRLSVDDVDPMRARGDARRATQLIFQDPFDALNPVHTIGYHLERPLLRHRLVARGRALRQRVHSLLSSVGLDPPEHFVRRLPHALSGGQRQRVAIARAIALEPRLLVADEPTSMLDVSLRAGILNLLTRLREEHRLAILFITHDLASARYIADRIVVMRKGRVVEVGETEDVIQRPDHPYTQQLLGRPPQEPSSGRRLTGGTR